MARDKTARDTELSRRPAIKKKLLDLFNDVERGFEDQRERSDDIIDFWDAYNCRLGQKQFYSGNSKLYVPIIRSAVEARKTRFINQMFPSTGRNIDVTTGDEEVPFGTISLLEHYISRTHLRTQVMPALLANGDVEGQYTVYVDWSKVTRHVVSRETRGVEVDGMEHPDLDEVEEIVEEEIVDSQPAVEVIADSDFIVLPVTADSIEEALEMGGSVTVIRRWSKAQIKKKIADGEIDKENGEFLLKSMSKRENQSRKDVAKDLASSAGIRMGVSGKFALVYETWSKQKIDGDQRITRSYYGGDTLILGCKLNPYWCDRVPTISEPRTKIPGVFKGRSIIAPGVLDLQVMANDAINEAADNLHFRLNPVMMIDPQKVGRWEGLFVIPGAAWPIDPLGAKILEFPNTVPDALNVVAYCQSTILQALSVNASMIPSTGGRTKRNQAELATEQQVDLLTTADAVTIIEGGILTPMIQRFAEYDSQFREDDIIIRSFGQLGLRAVMEEIPPIQVNRRYEFRWFGVEAARDAAKIQQQIAMANVFKGIPPEMYPDYTFDIAPLMEQMAQSAFGSRLAPLVFKRKDKQGIDPQIENEMMLVGFDVTVHPDDDDAEHLQVHGPVAPADLNGGIAKHIKKHEMQMQAKSMAAMQQMVQKGMPGGPGGAAPGVAGTPRPGAQPAQPRQNKGPPGMIRPDNMGRAGAVVQPRKT